MPQHRCGKRTHVPTPDDFVTDAQIAQVQPFSSPQEVLFCHQGFKCSQCQVQKSHHMCDMFWSGWSPQVDVFKWSSSVVELCCAVASQKMFDWPREKGYAGMQIIDSCRPRVFQV